MSHAHATFVFSDHSPLFGEYNGTSDVMLTRMFDAREEVEENWRQQEWKECRCGEDPVPCIAHTNYGAGYWWHGVACLKCRVFIGPRMPWEEDCETENSALPPDSTEVLTV